MTRTAYFCLLIIVNKPALTINFAFALYSLPELPPLLVLPTNTPTLGGAKRQQSKFVAAGGAELDCGRRHIHKMPFKRLMGSAGGRST